MADRARVLIVDDEVAFASGMADILNEKNYNTVFVDNAKDCLEKIKELTFDVILMDIRLPFMNGVELLKKIKEINPDIAVIMVTAYSAEDVVEDVLAQGAYGILHKPLDIDKTIKMIDAANKIGKEDDCG